jgi:hypothetical protein
MLRTLFRYFYYVAVLLLFPVVTNAQVFIPRVTRIGNPNPASNAAFGISVAGIGDVNGDGIGDLIVGAPGLDKVSIISGEDQSVLRTVGDPDGLSGYQFGFSIVGVGDWDWDGVDDFAVSAPGVPGVVPLPCVLPPCNPNPQWGRVFVISGATGALIKKFEPPEETLQFGYAMAPLGDINGDGKPDLAVGAPVLTNSVGHVYALSGVDGSQIWKATESGAGLSRTQPIASFGATLAALHDIDGDGKADLVVGAPFHDDGTGKLAGAAYVLSGDVGSQIRSHAPLQLSTEDRFGISVTNIGDQNGDGKDDYMVGDSKASKVYLFSGADGSYLDAIASRQLNDSFGFAAATVSDYDGDGKVDFWISAPDSDHVYLMNSAGTQLLDVPDPFTGNKSFGHSLSATKDLGGDKGLDLLVGAPGEVAGSGAAYLVTVREDKPLANAGADQTIECNRGGTVTLDGSASYDPDGEPITYAWKQVSGTTVGLTVSGATATFTAAPPGVYEFHLTVTDTNGASATDNVVVTIRDTTPPNLLVSLSPNTLWPPNHKMVDITANITVTDACDAKPTVKLVSITSNEPANSTGDGNTSPDIAGATFGTDDRSFQLRAERKGNGNGRVYTVTYNAQDASGNTAQQIATVTVAHDQGVSDYTVDASPISATIKQGQSAAFALTVSPINGFNQAVSFTCTGLPAGASCTFAPPSVTPNAGPVTTTLTVTTTAPSTHAGLYEPANSLWAQGGTFALAVLLVPGAFRRNLNRRKKLAVMLTLLVIVPLVSLLIACGGGGVNNSGTTSGGGTPGTSSPGTPLGASQVTVSSTAGASNQHDVSISITITQ